MFKRVLIANRGEIAIRIARAAASLGIDTVAVFTSADSLSLHTRLADKVREIGTRSADAVRGYLDIDAVIAAAKDSGSDCVHPGYGFLSENANFAERCRLEGLRFIGPSSATLALFGDKVEARAFAQAQGIPVVPGTPAALASVADARAMAQSVGYPVMLKASAGGGGRGMRAVARPEDMDEALARCQSEALSAFGNHSVFLEKIVPRPRHIEVQVLGDGQGNVVHLHERDCSVQLRNQKVIEVAPAPNLDETLRQRIHADAVILARAARYENAGTVEFLVNPDSGEHFFIECNPRIQVEHTITEQVLGLDLVEAQFRIANGASLASLGLPNQKAVGSPRGFAIQTRVVVQGTGTLSAYREPSGPGVRVDACGYVGLAPSAHFDPLLAKLICQSGSSGTFESAIDRTLRSLGEFHIVGAPTNSEQLRAILSHPEFRRGNARTTLLSEAMDPPKGEQQSALATLKFLDQQVAALGRLRGPGSTAPPPRPLPVPTGHLAIESPHAGSVIEIKARVGDAVATGQVLFVVTAMKMESSIGAPCPGIVETLAPIAIGASVDSGQILAVIKPSATSQTLTTNAGPVGEGWKPMLNKVAALQEIAHKRLLFHVLISPFKTQARLEAEIVLLRHQLSVLRQRAPSRPKLTAADRLLFVWLYRLFPSVLNTVTIIQPETVIRWHRMGFRLYWHWKSRSRGGRPKVPLEIRRLIREMSLANRLWGAPRIHGELLKLGIEVAQSTVAKYMARSGRGRSQTWKTFLHNHAAGIGAMNFLIVPTVSFKLLFVLVVLRHQRRRLISLSVTGNPTAEWIAHQITEVWACHCANATSTANKIGTLTGATALSCRAGR